MTPHKKFPQNGYLIFKTLADNQLNLWTIEDGEPGSLLSSVDGQQPYLNAEDEFRVILRRESDAHYFDCYINGQIDERYDKGEVQKPPPRPLPNVSRDYCSFE